MTRRIPRDTTPRCQDCGWVGKTTTAGLARAALGRHRCSRDQIRRDTAARVAARRAAEGPVRECTCKRASHRHGTYVAYVVDRCRCKPCRAANQRYEAHRTRQAMYGRWEPYVDATPIRAHVRDLMAAGIGLKRIVILSGVSHGAIWKLVYGKRRADGAQRRPSVRVRHETAAALLAVQPSPDNLADGARTDRTGTVRRLRALIALGWSQSELGRRIGVDGTNMTPIVLGRRDVTANTARSVAALYDGLSERKPPETNRWQRISASRSRNRAAAAGWLVPAWWDDDTIDDPAANPVTTEPRLPGRPPGHLTEDVAWLAKSGQSLHAIAAQLGVTVGAIETAHRRAGIPLPDALLRSA